MRSAAAREGSWGRLASRAAVVLCCLVLVWAGFWAFSVLVRQGAAALDFAYPINYGEGPLLDQAVRLASSVDIYRADLSEPPFVVANYPPLYALAQAPFVWAFGPAFWYGRGISLLCAGASAALVGLIVHALTRSKAGALVGTLVFLSFPYVLLWSPLARVDFMGLALSLAGLWVAARRTEGRVALLLAALLLVAAVYTRQSLGLAAPLAALCWLVSSGRGGRAWRLAALVGGIGTGLLVLLSAITGGGFFFGVVTANLNEMRWEQVAERVGELGANAPYPLAAAGAFLAIAPFLKTRSWFLVAPYALGALASALLIAKVGSDVNYLLELSAALGLCAGALVARAGAARLLQALLVLLFAFQVWTAQDWWQGSYERIHAYRLGQGADAGALAAVVREADGPVLADEYAGLLPLEGRRIYLQPFEMAQLQRDGRWDQGPLLRSLGRREFPAILVWEPPYAPGIERDRWTPGMLEAIEADYEPAEVHAETVVYRPRRETVSAGGSAPRGPVR